MSLKVPSREQLKKFLPDHESIVQFEQLFGNTTSLEQLLNVVIKSVGLNTNGTYTPESTAHYIHIANTLFNADVILDQAIFDYSKDEIISTSVSIALTAKNQTIIADAAAGVINITLPNPALSLINNRSYKIGVTKKDISTNKVNILPFGTELVVGETLQFLDVDGEVLNFITDGTNWYLGA